MPNLGERLRANIDRMEQLKIDKAARADAEKLAAEIKRKAEIGSKIEQFKKNIVDDIWRGLVLKPMRLPNNWWSSQTGDVPISNTRHPDNHIWHDFEVWAHDNGLRVECVYEHDGFGMKSWYELKVTPI
jgi:hypothetical protein